MQSYTVSYIHLGIYAKLFGTGADLDSNGGRALGYQSKENQE